MDIPDRTRLKWIASDFDTGNVDNHIIRKKQELSTKALRIRKNLQ